MRVGWWVGLVLCCLPADRPDEFFVEQVYGQPEDGHVVRRQATLKGQPHVYTCQSCTHNTSHDTTRHPCESFCLLFLTSSLSRYMDCPLVLVSLSRSFSSSGGRNDDDCSEGGPDTHTHTYAHTRTIFRRPSLPPFLIDRPAMRSSILLSAATTLLRRILRCCERPQSVELKKPVRTPNQDTQMSADAGMGTSSGRPRPTGDIESHDGRPDGEGHAAAHHQHRGEVFGVLVLSGREKRRVHTCTHTHA